MDCYNTGDVLTKSFEGFARGVAGDQSSDTAYAVTVKDSTAK
jgi:hypothetical protein